MHMCTNNAYIGSQVCRIVEFSIYTIREMYKILKQNNWRYWYDDDHPDDDEKSFYNALEWIGVCIAQ